MYTREQVEAAVRAKGYVWFEGAKDYDVNIVGIRNSVPGQAVTNLFDDWLTVSYRVGGQWKFHIWPATTDPGRKGVLEYGNPGGVARLVEGQYRGSHAIGLHKGKYTALRQRNPVKVFRDSNKDMKYDETRIFEGVFGINIHKAGKDSTRVENWSEGCQVFKREADFNEFMAICAKARENHGNAFTYTLIESNDISNPII
jgi:hypothetical protein